MYQFKNKTHTTNNYNYNYNRSNKTNSIDTSSNNFIRAYCSHYLQHQLFQNHNHVCLVNIYCIKRSKSNNHNNKHGIHKL